MPIKHKSSYILEVKIVIFLQDVTYKAFFHATGVFLYPLENLRKSLVF